MGRLLPVNREERIFGIANEGKYNAQYQQYRNHLLPSHRTHFISTILLLLPFLLILLHSSLTTSPPCPLTPWQPRSKADHSTSATVAPVPHPRHPPLDTATSYTRPSEQLQPSRCPPLWPRRRIADSLRSCVRPSRGCRRRSRCPQRRLCRQRPRRASIWRC